MSRTEWCVWGALTVTVIGLAVVYGAPWVIALAVAAAVAAAVDKSAHDSSARMAARGRVNTTGED